MKKQLLIAAVAATMTSVAFADISITGGSKVNYTNTDYDASGTESKNVIAHDTDFTIVGKNGGTTVSATFAVTQKSVAGVLGTANTPSTGTVGGTVASNGSANTPTTLATGGLNAENVFMSSSIGDVNVKVGTWDNGDDFVSESARAHNKLSANTTIGGVKVIFDTANGSDDAVTLSGSFGGVNASYKEERLGEEMKLSTTVQGVTIAYHTDNSDSVDADKSSIALSGSVSGMDLTYVQISADTNAIIQGDSLAGDFEGNTGAYLLTADQDVTAMKVSTAMAGNTVAFTRTNVDGVTGEDTTINEFVVTRPLASGATFEAKYTDINDDHGTANDATKLDLELAVKF